MITVLMATFNGAPYVVQQLDSLMAQTCLPDRIVVRDDHSTDATLNVLNHYQANHVLPIEIQVNPANSGGSAQNFMSLMTTVRDDYVMLCDQDDVWLPDKIELSYAKLRAMEEQYGVGTPCLVHSDLTVVDDHLQPVSESFRASTFADYDRTKLRDQIIQNTATGCTIMYNRALANLITHTPEHMVMHDWWISLIAAAFGHMDHLDEATILYRQHAGNQIGVTDMRTVGYKLHRLTHPSGVRADIAKTYPQAAEFREVFADRLTDQQKSLLDRYVAIPSLGKLKRIATVARLGTWKTGFSRNVAYLLFI